MSFSNCFGLRWCPEHSSSSFHFWKGADCCYKRLSCQWLSFCLRFCFWWHHYRKYEKSRTYSLALVQRSQSAIKILTIIEGNEVARHSNELKIYMFVTSTIVQDTTVWVEDRDSFCVMEYLQYFKSLKLLIYSSTQDK